MNYDGTATDSFAGTLGTATLNHFSVTKSGTGALELKGNNAYSGGTTVSAGALFVNNSAGSATGSGALSVGAGATLGGTGTSSGSSFNISGSSSARANVLVGQSFAGDTTTAGQLTLVGSNASTLAAANLSFNLKADGTSNELQVQNTAVSFGTVGALNTTLTLNVQGAAPAINTAYVLIAGTAVGTDALSSQFASGLSFGASSGSLSTGLTTLILDSNQGGSGNLTLAGLDSTLAQNSYLFLYQNSTTGVDAIEVEVDVVPEPGTWAMLLGGLGLLLFWQRRKRQKL
ncbi:MAG: autotransporter-associated beta strand repeat-containing protein [Verrucomicrobiota bacterium]